MSHVPRDAAATSAEVHSGTRRGGAPGAARGPGQVEGGGRDGSVWVTAKAIRRRRARDDTHGWVEVPLDQFLGPAGDGCSRPFQAFLNRFKSSSPDWEVFLHDPLRSMLMEPGALANVAGGWPDFPGDDDSDPRENVPGGAVAGDPGRPAVPDSHPGSFVNQNRKLSKIHASTIVIVSPDGIQTLKNYDTHKDGAKI